MDALFDSTFARWTSGLDPLASRRAIFGHIRDMPYTQYPGLGIQDWMRFVLEKGRGSCTPKQSILNAMFRRLGIAVTYLTCPMRWADQPLDFPRELRQLAGKLPTVCHLAAKARLTDVWVLVDATYDPPLARIGAPVNLDWDGLSDTRLAVVALDVIEHDTEQEHIDFRNNQRQSLGSEDTANLQAFASGLNAWFDAVRDA